MTAEGHTTMIESGITLSLGEKLEERGSKVFYRVKGVGGPTFDTDMDILEIRGNMSFAYEVKGIRKKNGKKGKRELVGPRTLEGVDQALIHLNYADVSYLVHPEIMFRGEMKRSQILARYLPIGYIIATVDGKFIKLVSAQKSPINVGKVFNRKRLANISAFADTSPYSIEKEFERYQDRYRNFSIGYSEGNSEGIKQILDSICLF